MKRLTLVLLMILITGLSACTDNKAFPSNITCEDILNAAQSVGEKPDSEKLYLKSENNLDTFSMSLWADGTYEECEELDLLSDYAIYLGAGTETYEITVLKAKDIKKTENIKSLIERRKETLSLGDKGAYDPNFKLRIENSVLLTEGEFVIFLVTDNNIDSIKEIEALKK